MEKSRLGRTGLLVSRLGFGAATCGSPLVSEEETYKMVKRSLDAGVNIFDTSPFYGRRESERKLGLTMEKILKKYSRESLVLGTKSGHFDYPDHGDFSYEMTKRSVEHSLRLLRTPYLDYVIAHDVEFAPNLKTVYNGTVRAIEEFRDKGLVKFIGISGGKPKQLIKAIQNGKFDLVLTYNSYTPLHQNGQELTDEASKLDVGVINGSPLGFGMFTGKNPADILAQYPENPDYSNLQKAIKLYELSKKHNIPMMQFALQFPMSNPKIATTLTGPASLGELEQNLELATKPLPKNVEAEMMKIAIWVL